MKRDADYEDLSVDGAVPVGLRRVDGFPAVAATLVATFAWVVAWFWPTAASIASVWWRSETYAHGLVVLPIFAWLVWRAQDRIGALRPQPLPGMALAVGLAGLMWIVGELAAVGAASHFALVAMLVAALVGVLGRALARVLLFPLAFLAFAVPIGDFLLPTLMNLTAEFTVGALRLSGVPVFQEGLHFVVPNGRWSVVEACSGIRYLIASTMIGALYAYLTYTSLKKRLLFMLVALLVPIVANWLRAYMIVMLGYLSSNRIAAGVDHLIYGWLFFGVVVMLMFWIGGRWRDPLPPRAADVAAKPGAERTNWAAAAPVALAIAAIPLAHGVLDRPVKDYAVTLELPTPAPGWTATAEDDLRYRPSYAGARGQAFAVYGAPDGQPVAVFAAWYADQRRGSEMVAWGNGLVRSAGGQTRVVSQSGVDAPSGRVVGANLVTPDGRLRAWQWYLVNDRIVTRDAEAKLYLALDRLLGRPDDSAVVVLYTPVADDDGGAADRRLAAFLREHEAALERALARAAEGRP